MSRKSKDRAFPRAFLAAADLLLVRELRVLGYKIDGPEFVARVMPGDTLQFSCPVCLDSHLHGYPENTDSTVHRSAHCSRRELDGRLNVMTEITGYNLRPITGNNIAFLNDRAMSTWVDWLHTHLARERRKVHPDRYVCERCGCSYSPGFSDDGICGDLSYARGDLSAAPCPGRLRPFLSGKPMTATVARVPFTTARDLAQALQPLETIMMRGDVRFHREGDKFAISTNTETERDFLDGAASALTELLPAADEMARWLPLIVDISAKMRGYKADVIEKRLIVAGAWLPADMASVVAGAGISGEAVVARNELEHATA